MNYNQLGMMGTSVLYSSGDDGVAGGNGLCLTSSGLFIFISNFSYFDWVFQGKSLNQELDLILASPQATIIVLKTIPCQFVLQVTCPFITAVGATQINPGSTVSDPEGACEQAFFSGGGFSNIFA